MSALGHKRTLKSLHLMSALPPKADIAKRRWDVRFVPEGDIRERKSPGKLPGLPKAKRSIQNLEFRQRTMLSVKWVWVAMVRLL
jgi:hypothetical protein